MIMASCLISSPPTATATASSPAKANNPPPPPPAPPPPPLPPSLTYPNNHLKGNQRVNGNTPNTMPANGSLSSTCSSGSSTRIIRLKKIGNSPLGFSIRGGWEHGTGIFVSEVHSKSEAERQGLMAGDQIIRVNGFSIEQAIHDEVIALIKSNSTRIVLKVKSVGMIPIKEKREDVLSWKLVDSKGGTPCPVHAKSGSAWSPTSSGSSRTRSASSHSSSSGCCESGHRQDVGSIGEIEYMEAKVFLKLTNGQGLGCSVIRGPPNYPGIYVQSVKPVGVAHEAGLEVGDQIIGMNGFTFYPNNFDFNDAIAKIKACNQMTLTVKKKVGLHLFVGNGSGNGSANGTDKKKSLSQRVKADVHQNPEPIQANGYHPQHHSPVCPQHSRTSSNATSSGSSSARYYEPSERDYSICEVDPVKEGQYVSTPPCKVHPNGHHNGHEPSSDPLTSAQSIYEEVIRKEELLAEERKKLEFEQKRLKQELEKLDVERKQLETMKQQEDVSSTSSISSASIGSSGSGVVSSLSNSNSGSGSASRVGFGFGPGSVSGSSGSQMGFLDELKKLAEKRTGDGLITDTLNKTKHLEKAKDNKLKQFGPDDDKRKKHEMLMEEFRKAHKKMFGPGLGPGLGPGSGQGSGDTSSCLEMPSSPKAVLKKPLSSTCSAPVFSNGNVTRANDHFPLPVKPSTGHFPPKQSSLPTNGGASGAEKVTILRTTSPAKKNAPPPPPPPSKKSAPIVTISTYQSNQPKNRFVVNGVESNRMVSVNSGVQSEVGPAAGNRNASERDIQPNGVSKPISIKINVQLPNTEK